MQENNNRSLPRLSVLKPSFRCFRHRNQPGTTNCLQIIFFNHWKFSIKTEKFRLFCFIPVGCKNQGNTRRPTAPILASFFQHRASFGIFNKQQQAKLQVCLKWNSHESTIDGNSPIIPGIIPIFQTIKQRKTIFVRAKELISLLWRDLVGIGGTSRLKYNVYWVNIWNKKQPNQ